MILTLKELAEHLKVNERTILRMLKIGQIEGRKIGGQWRFNGSQIDKVFFPDEAAAEAVSGDEEPVSLNDLTHTSLSIPISRMLSTSRMLMDLKSTDRDSVIEELTDPRLFNDLVLDTRDLQEKCLQRELLCSTAVGMGIAVPHPRDPIATLQVPGCVTYGFSKKGVDFGAFDGEPVHMFFLVCAQTVELHLYLMGNLAHVLKEKDVVEKCMNAKEPEDIIKAFMEQERNAFLQKNTEDFE